MIGKCGKKSAKINLSKTWLLIFPFEVFGAGYLRTYLAPLEQRLMGASLVRRSL